MKKIIAFLIVLILTSNHLNAQSYGLGNVDPSLFTKYKIPDTDLHSLWFNTDFSFNSTKNSNYYQNDYFNSSNSEVNLIYSLSPHYFLLKQTDDRTLSLAFDLNGSYNYQRNNAEAQYSTGQKEKTTEAELNLELNSNYHKYMNSGNLFYSLASSIEINLNEQKKEDLANIYNSSYFNVKSQIYSVSAGLGWGRLRDVTPVVEAIRFQERLKQLNTLNNDLNEKTIEDLAQKFSQVNYYPDVYNRDSKYFWQDVEKILSKDGVSLAGLNQYSDSYLKEVLNEVRFARKEGLEINLSIQITYLNQYQYHHQYQNEGTYHYLDSYGPHVDEWSTGILVGSISYSHQLNLNSQLNSVLSLSGWPNLIRSGSKYHYPDNIPTRQAYYINYALGYNYELTDKLVAIINNSFALHFQNADIQQGKNLSDILSFDLIYFVEDNLSLKANYTWNYKDDKTANYINEFVDNNHKVSIGFTYFINRGLIF